MLGGANTCNVATPSWLGNLYEVLFEIFATQPRDVFSIQALDYCTYVIFNFVLNLVNYMVDTDAAACWRVRHIGEP